MQAASLHFKVSLDSSLRSSQILSLPSSEDECMGLRGGMRYFTVSSRMHHLHVVIVSSYYQTFLSLWPSSVNHQQVVWYTWLKCTQESSVCLGQCKSHCSTSASAGVSFALYVTRPPSDLAIRRMYWLLQNVKHSACRFPHPTHGVQILKMLGNI